MSPFKITGVRLYFGAIIWKKLRRSRLFPQLVLKLSQMSPKDILFFHIIGIPCTNSKGRMSHGQVMKDM